MFVCEVCKKEYQSRSGLRRHVKAKHRVVSPVLPLPIETAGGDEGTEDTKAGEGPASERREDRPSSEGLAPPCSVARSVGPPQSPVVVEGKEAKKACKDLGIDEDDVMAYRVYHEPLKVVLIEGPVGHKRVWTGG